MPHDWQDLPKAPVDPEIAKALREAAPNNKITCEAARRLAHSLGISYKQMGEAASSLGIKIHACQLGCF